MINIRPKHKHKHKLKTKYLIRRLVTVSVFLLLILMISSLFVKNGSKNEAKGVYNELDISKTGSIAFVENEFYKKYTINCTEIINEINSKEDKSKFQITINKSEISDIDIKKVAKDSLGEINIEENKDLIIINFKKLTEVDNYVHLDYKNHSKVIIFIKKNKIPFKYNVVVDPGHGGVDVGTYYGKLFEKDLTLKISKYMVDNLRYNGCNVTFTRSTDVLLDKLVKQDLIKRSNLANDEKADVFVSVHINSNTENEYNGVSTYYYGEASNQQTERAKLAQAIQKEMLRNDAWKNISTHGDDLSVLRNTKMPSVLVECGFISNSLDRKKLSNETTLVNFGQNISNGIIKYLADAEIENNNTK
ncbi:N-acetylmuramoyl-L-alanine amidase family protein [Clostridium lacusfryxellense]|uniref:N-acetylmuramoyl-L-alanine amidase family protein n=1 Tax=Clostridium lacusfryxellense TaxID=205328 RepID=UPI001C0D0B61|nr:N-acetylmuramoyl-L-alanine amidase [Clostridium lacusfryxellense]MBU3113532.1 N-acetylmuramoyl-L-alanine amidase [Clostridium lacusfryxellense]